MEKIDYDLKYLFHYLFKYTFKWLVTISLRKESVVWLVYDIKMAAEVKLASVLNRGQGRQFCCGKSGYLEMD